MTQNERVYVIYCRLEVDYDVISGTDVDTFRYYAFCRTTKLCLSSYPDVRTGGNASGSSYVTQKRLELDHVSMGS